MASPSRKERLVTRRGIEGLVAEGHAIVILQGKVLKVDAWLPYHPGGDKAIMHMVGRDATDEVTVLHSPEALQRMLSYQIGRIEGQWKCFTPPIQGGVFRKLGEEDSVLDVSEECSTDTSSREQSPMFDSPTREVQHRGRGNGATTPASSISSLDLKKDIAGSLGHMDAITQQKVDLDLETYPSLDPATQEDIRRKYRDMHEHLQREGLFDCNYGAYAWEMSRYVLLGALSIISLHYGWYTTSGLLLGMLWHQLVFTVHDAGHMGITHNFQVDTVIGILIADFIGGLSIGWWKRSHNVHHIVTNSPEHDPDIQHMPFFMVSHRFFGSLRSTYHERVMNYDAFARVFARIQKYTYYPILLFGRFNLYALSWDHLIRGRSPRKGPAWWHRWLEIIGNVFFWVWFGYGILYKSIPTTSARIAFLLASHMITAPLHVQITLSHFAMSTADHGVSESFPQRMLRTTMDVDCPEWLDFFHGGLQFQAIHHLYPRMPRHNLRRAQKVVMDFCKDVGIPYALYGFVDGNKEVIGRLGEVGRHAAILAECQRSIVDSGDFLHHH
jgi:delta8-fatty-acid desaturase